MTMVGRLLLTLHGGLLAPNSKAKECIRNTFQYTKCKFTFKYLIEREAMRKVMDKIGPTVVCGANLGEKEKSHFHV